MQTKIIIITGCFSLKLAFDSVLVSGIYVFGYFCDDIFLYCFITPPPVFIYIFVCVSEGTMWVFVVGCMKKRLHGNPAFFSL